ncbi:NYN domain-containing protein [Pseudoroseicyclus tamaricis]|uniref:NYN domain-containing protein n=1 Tax=Pseudoroseicyclus tamaricis TaxID=2705421 RepID=A0A6B2JYL8_9RHOB|nr:NYN domain-containing protein [Pseudoroseicyclus tamaricis]NDV01709.1 NYN domain-containing protein [Pseudoroseicyclus tamaricis]
MTAPRAALFIDAENISPAHADSILRLARGTGQLVSAQAYGDATRQPAWRQVPGLTFVHVEGSRPCATDIRLIVDAMHQAAEGRWDRLCLASSDQDYIPLLTALRAMGRTVTLLGEAKAPPALRAASDVFLELGAEEPPAAAPSRLDLKVRALIAEHSANGRGMPLTSLGCQMSQKHGVAAKSLVEGTWRSYAKARPALFEVDPPGEDARIRFRPSGFAGPARLTSVA